MLLQVLSYASNMLTTMVLATESLSAALDDLESEKDGDDDWHRTAKNEIGNDASEDRVEADSVGVDSNVAGARIDAVGREVLERNSRHVDCHRADDDPRAYPLH